MFIRRKGMQLMLAALAAVLMIGVGGAGSAMASAKTKTDNDQSKANVTAYLQTSPNVTVTPGSDVTYTVTVMNSGKGPARNTTTVVPFDPAKLKLIDVKTNSATAWLSDIAADHFEVQSQQVASGGGQFIITAHFAVLANVANGTALGERASYSWSDANDKGAGVSNMPILSVADSDINQDTYALAGGTSTSNGHTVSSFSSSIFIPGESVTLWYNTPSGKVVDLEIFGSTVVDASSTKSKDNGGNYMFADANGAISAQLRTDDLAPGTYSMVARGNVSGLTAVGSFEVQ